MIERDWLNPDKPRDPNRDWLEIKSQENASSEKNEGGYFIVDEGTGLKFPPDPRTPYNGRSAKYGRISLEDFLEKEWGDYTSKHLLYSEHIRAIDYPLYKALYYRARTSEPSHTLEEYAIKHGILMLAHLRIGDSRYPKQIALLRKVRLEQRAHTLQKQAQEQN